MVGLLGRGGGPRRRESPGRLRRRLLPSAPALAGAALVCWLCFGGLDHESPIPAWAQPSAVPVLRPAALAGTRPGPSRRATGQAGEGGAATAPADSEAWRQSVQALVHGVEGCSEDDADAWLREGFGWTRSSQRFWRRARVEQEPEPAAVQAVLEWLEPRGLATRAWVAKFPVVVGLAAEDLEASRSTAPSYMKAEDAYLRSIKANPKLLGKNYDCMDEHDSCQGLCSRCWNS
mmetsp:Transcript_78773/g.244409  ORF Transcript_78773/g.244409 Transcript_78773/m.244409 type:complete len:233 (+) Transcript_78773:97-795(+)